MFAIVEACGRQYQLEAGRFVDIDLADGSNGDNWVFDKVLMIVDGANSTTGAPYIDGAKVTGRILCNMKGRKVIVYHQRPKKGTRKKQGHRQHYTRIIVDTIELKDQVLAKAEGRKTEPKPEKKAKAPVKEVKEKKPAKAAAPKAKKEAAGKGKAEPKTQSKAKKQ
jgi:large subunit ribosomal protein L21